jgi:hypothetical protein
MLAFIIFFIVSKLWLMHVSVVLEKCFLHILGTQSLMWKYIYIFLKKKIKTKYHVELCVQLVCKNS